MTPIEEAILRTVIYADIFNFPLTRGELHHFLIAERPFSPDEIEQALAESLLLRQEVGSVSEYVVCSARPELIDLREARSSVSRHLWPLALTYGQWLARLPFVRMVALTGALAMRNASEQDDDLDYVLVTTPGRVWLARACAIVLVRLALRRGVVVCPNYVLAETALAQDKHDLFMAHEVTQMVPIYGEALYRAMREQNRWADEYLPNADGAFYAERERSVGRGWSGLKGALEIALGGRLGDALEGWEYRRKLRRFSGEMQTPHNAAQLDEQRVKGHFKDHGHPVLQEYESRMRGYAALVPD